MIGKSVSLFLSLGIYNTDYLEDWVDELLTRKGVRKFKDVEQKGRKLKITASDLTEKRLLVLPDDLVDFATDPDEFCIAPAVRMSVSIPIFFEPVRWKDLQGKEHLVVDGGLLSNYPMWLLDDGRKAPDYPVFGFRFVDDKNFCKSRSCQAGPNLVDYLKAIVSTSLDAIDHHDLAEGDYERTIRISAASGTGEQHHKISAVDFDISREDSRALFENGWNAAERFLSAWNFDSWKKRYR